VANPKKKRKNDDEPIELTLSEIREEMREIKKHIFHDFPNYIELTKKISKIKKNVNNGLDNIFIKLTQNKKKIMEDKKYQYRYIEELYQIVDEKTDLDIEKKK
jgi:hypothetical protein